MESLLGALLVDDNQCNEDKNKSQQHVVPEQDTEEGQDEMGFNPGSKGSAHLLAREKAKQDAHSLGKGEDDDTGHQHVVPHEERKQNVVANRSTQDRKASNNVDEGGLGGSRCETHFRFLLVGGRLFVPPDASNSIEHAAACQL